MPATPLQHRLLHTSPPLRGAVLAPSQTSTRRGEGVQEGLGAKGPQPLHNHLPSARNPPTPEGRCAGRSRGALSAFLSWLAGAPMQGAPPLRCGVRREGGLRAGGDRRGIKTACCRPCAGFDSLTWFRTYSREGAGGATCSLARMASKAAIATSIMPRSGSWVVMRCRARLGATRGRAQGWAIHLAVSRMYS